MTKAFVLLLCMLAIAKPSPASASEQAGRFCFQKVINETGFGKLVGHNASKDSKFPIFYLKSSKYYSKPVLLVGDKLVQIKGEFPNSRRAIYAVLPDGEVIATSRAKNGHKTTFYKQSQSDGTFSKLNFGYPQLEAVSDVQWSDVLQGVLISTTPLVKNKENAALYLLKNNKLTKFEGIEAWLQTIINLPDLNMTFLSGKEGDIAVIYIVDANGNMHKVVEKKLYKSAYFGQVYHLTKPDRLLVSTGGAVGKFIIPLEKKDGVFIPQKVDDINDIASVFATPSKYHHDNHVTNMVYLKKAKQFLFYARNYEDIIVKRHWFKKDKVIQVPHKMYIVGENKFIEFDGKDDEIINELPPHFRKNYRVLADHPLHQPNKFYRHLDMPSFDEKLVVGQDGVFIVDNKENMIPLSFNNFNVRMQYSNIYLKARNEILFIGEDLYLLKDTKISGGCN